MKYTPTEIAELLKERPHQPHYIEWLVRQAIKAEVERDTALLRQALWALESAPFMFPQCPQTIIALRERLGDKT